MAGVFSKISGIMSACALGVALTAAPHAPAEAPGAQPPDLSQTNPAMATLQQADWLIEKYVQPVIEQQPTPEETQAIQTAVKLLESGQGTKEQSAIEQFVEIGPPALGELRRLAAAPPDNSVGGNPTAMLAAITIRRIEALARRLLLEQLLCLGDSARAVLYEKLSENSAAADAAGSEVEAATAALVKASANATLDSPAVAQQRKALAEAQTREKEVRARRALLLELNLLLNSRPPAPPTPPQAQAQAPEEQPPTPSADVLNIQPISPPMISPPMGAYSSEDESQPPEFFGGGFETGNMVNRYSHRGAESRRMGHADGGHGDRAGAR